MEVVQEVTLVLGTFLSGCPRSWLQHAGSLLQLVGSSSLSRD